MVTLTQIQTELNAQWNTGVIAKPSFDDRNLKYSLMYPNKSYIKMAAGADIKPSAINGSLQPRQTPFSIEVIAASSSDRDKFIGEFRRIINAKTISGGWWHTEGLPKMQNVGIRYIAKILCYERNMIAASGWS